MSCCSSVGPPKDAQHQNLVVNNILTTCDLRSKNAVICNLTILDSLTFAFQNVVVEATVSNIVTRFGSLAPISILFDSVSQNSNNSYDPLTGIFTAPVDGLYHISVNGRFASGNVQNVSIFQNGIEKAGASCTIGGGAFVVQPHINMNVADVYRLAAGDQILATWQNVSVGGFNAAMQPETRLKVVRLFEV